MPTFTCHRDRATMIERDGQPFAIIMRGRYESPRTADTPTDADIEAFARLAARAPALRDALNAMRRYVDVSTINPSKRTTARWEALVAQADEALAGLD